MTIRFFYEEPNFKIKNQRQIARWIKESAKNEKKDVIEINYIFCNDKYLLELNQGFLNHNTLTDIITFDNSEDSSIAGEVYISIERVSENAVKFMTSFDDELRRIIIHGALHLFGYNDKKPLEKIVMRKKEDAYLSLWNNVFHVKR